MDVLPAGLAQLSFSNNNGRVANQVGRQEVHGGQYIYLNQNGVGSAVSRRCVVVPYSTVSTYIARPSLSERLSQKLQTPAGRKSRRAVAVTGLGGTGKTQLVLDYLEEHEQDYHTILWIDATSEATARASYEQCALALALEIGTPTNPPKLENDPAVKAVHTWLHDADQRWLVVLDNVNGLDASQWITDSLVPGGRAGSVVLTSQDHQASKLLGTGCAFVRVDVMDASQAMQLMSTLVDIGGQPPTAEARAAMEQLAGILDHLPIALDVVGNHVRMETERGQDLHAVLLRHHAYFRDCMNKPEAPSNPSLLALYNRISSAWEESFAALERFESQLSLICTPRALLAYLSHIDQDVIHDEVFRLAAGKCYWNPGVIQPIWFHNILLMKRDGTWKEIHYHDTIHELQRYGLVQRVTENHAGVMIHGLVRRRARAFTSAEISYSHYVSHMDAAATAFASAKDATSFDEKFLSSYLPDHRQLAHKNFDYGIASNRQASEAFARAWAKVNQHEKAKELFLACVTHLESTKGLKFRETLLNKYNLSVAYSDLGEDGLAEDIRVEILPVMEEVLGETNASTMRVMNALAATFRKRRKLDQAREMGERVLRLRRETLGEEHTDTLQSMGSLMATYFQQSDWGGVEQLGEQLLPVQQAKFSEDRTRSAQIMNNLGVAYLRQGKLEQAETMTKRTLIIRQEVLGPLHRDTLQSMAHLGSVYHAQGRYKECHEVDLQLLAGREQVLGRKHRDTMKMRYNVAQQYAANAREGPANMTRARKLMQETVVLSKEVFGEEHPETLDAVHALGRMDQDIRQMEEAKGRQLSTRKEERTSERKEQPHYQPRYSRIVRDDKGALVLRPLQKHKAQRKESPN